MALPRNHLLLKLLAVAAVFFAALATFVLVNRATSGAPSTAYSSDDNPAALASAPTDTQIRAYQALVRAHPNDSRGYDVLAGAYLQKVRETGDSSYYTRACRTGASCTANFPARSAGCSWRCPPAGRHPRTSPTCKPSWATSTSRPATWARLAMPTATRSRASPATCPLPPGSPAWRRRTDSSRPPFAATGTP